MGKQKREEEAQKAAQAGKGVPEAGETHSNAGPGGEWPGGRKAGGDATGGNQAAVPAERILDYRRVGNQIEFLLEGSQIVTVEISGERKEAWNAGRVGSGNPNPSGMTGSTAVEENEDAG